MTGAENVVLNGQTLTDDVLERNYDLKKTAQWIEAHNFQKVSLQFPDDMLPDSYSVCEKLKEMTGRTVYISVDTTYSNCCIDEISAKHVDADAIVHYGHACLSPNDSSVYYVHPKSPLDIGSLSEAVDGRFDRSSKLVVFYHASYHHLSDEIRDALFRRRAKVLTATLAAKGEGHRTIFGRRVTGPDSDADLESLEDFEILYIGGDDQTLFNLAVSVKNRGLYMLDPDVGYELKPYSQSVWLRRRRYVIEKCKDAKNIGILVCTLSITNFTSIIARLRSLIGASGKKSYVLTLGRPNVAKLANLYEIDVFVLIACPENDLYSCRDFMTPLAYPFEVELALNRSRDPYASDYYTDFNDLLSGGRGYCEILAEKDDGSDISLITGRARNAVRDDEEKDGIVGSSDVALRGNMAIANADVGAHLAERTWKGLEQKLGETEVVEVQKGRRGIAGKYEEEPL